MIVKRGYNSGNKWIPKWALWTMHTFRQIKFCYLDRGKTRQQKGFECKKYLKKRKSDPPNRQ